MALILKFDVSSAKIVESDGLYEIIGTDGKDYGSLPATGVSKDGKNISFHYSLTTSTEVVVSATPSGGISPSDFGSDAKCWLGVVGSGVGGALAGASAGSAVPGLGTAMGALDGAFSGTSVGTATFC
ncbi:hypothetical protein [Rathayibacter toxicus]|uniref:hypothetical protein n=1 Tax=Rathayibacter toxicus TaxID=145458 RepID=UPI000CE738EB|nr:hypothetical protein [Rathayibacter toxicus]PPH25522.1 hypothetical protein C5D17_00410 [Rathayibacter toxicus]PPH61334.1 hypothetical protein C5C93_00410 [Rathayibacter toxicus]PPH89300.1 hypothetical protein C5D31_00415 [Rathayibacter toxicus]PPI67474.1 hypothetical protein C5D47_00410 [Rathayibacter toxicus]QWL48226.1 hypothetical protein E2R43_00305 [Rathayibacter toxicus]